MEQQPPSINQSTSPVNAISEQQIYTVKKKPNYLPLLIIVIGVLLLSSAILGVFWWVQKDTTTLQEQPNPLLTVEGYVEKVEGNTLTLSHTIYAAEESGAEKKSYYQVEITSQTKMTTVPTVVPYSLKTASTSASSSSEVTDNTTTLANLTPGRRVSVVTSENLHNYSVKKAVEAVSLTVFPGVTSVHGTISQISDTIFVLKAAPPSVPEPKEFSFTIDKMTEIVESGLKEGSSDSPTPRQLPQSELQIGVEVQVYTEVDINHTTQLLAKKVVIY